MSFRERFANPNAHFFIGISVVLLLTFVHALALPLVVSYDGMEYAHLANVLSGPSVISHWNFYRTPLFPLALNRAFWLGGEQPNSALFVTTLFGVAGILLVGLIVRKIAGGTCGAIALVLIVFYPVLVGYQHMLLSETGTFFWIALLLWSLVSPAPTSKRGEFWVPYWIALVIAVGYYWRPTILYLAPVAALIFLWIKLGSPTGNRNVITGVLIIAIAPFLLAYPWMHLTAKHSPGTHDDFLAQGMFRQVLVPIDDPLLAPVKGEYKAAIEHDLVNGRLPLDGVNIGGHKELLNKIRTLFVRAGVWRLIRKYPLRYLEGAAKSMLFFLGVPDHRVDDENWNFSRTVFALWPQTETLDRTIGWDPKFVQFTPQPYKGGALVGTIFDALLPVYTWLVLASAMASFIWMVVSLKQADPVGLTLTAIPFALLVLHAFTLQAADRYAFPLYPVVLANFVIITRSIWVAFRERDVYRPRQSDWTAKVVA